jgi:hypothetical protein
MSAREIAVFAATALVSAASLNGPPASSTSAGGAVQNRLAQCFAKSTSVVLLECPLECHLSN